MQLGDHVISQRAHCVVQRVSEQQERLRVRRRRERRQPRFG